MNRKYLLKSSIQRARLSRLIAKSIDFTAALLPCFFYFPVGLFVSLTYLAIADALNNGQSLGKKVIGLAVISLENGKPCTYKQSIVRNLPVFLPLLFSFFPFWGPIITILLWLPLVGLELYLIYNLNSGHRLGDVMADTTVMANDGTQMMIRSGQESWFANNSAATPAAASE